MARRVGRPRKTGKKGRLVCFRTKKAKTPKKRRKNTKNTKNTKKYKYSKRVIPRRRLY